MPLTSTDLHVGDRRTEVLVKDLSRTQLVMYAGASGDYNPLHTDDLFAREAAGYPGVFAHGMLTMGITAKLLTDWVGDGRLTNYGVRFVHQVWPGDSLTATAEVTAITGDGDHLIAEFSIVTTNQHDVAVVTGSATARIDS